MSSSPAVDDAVLDGMTTSVLVTGASQGIGRTVTLHLAEQGRCVFAASRNVTVPFPDGLPVVAVQMDVTDQLSISQAREQLVPYLDKIPLAGVVSNAGVAVGGPWEYLSSDDLRLCLEVNVVGAMEVVRQFLPSLKVSKGRIVFIGSVSGRVASPFLGPYCASKFALEAVADSLRRELTPWNIPVTVIQPGPVKTPLWAKFRQGIAEKFNHTPYADRMKKLAMQSRTDEETAQDTDVVAKAVSKALFSPRPHTRIPVVRGPSWFFRLQTALPDRWVDAVFHRDLGEGETVRTEHGDHDEE